MKKAFTFLRRILRLIAGAIKGANKIYQVSEFVNIANLVKLNDAEGLKNSPFAEIFEKVVAEKFKSLTGKCEGEIIPCFLKGFMKLKDEEKSAVLLKCASYTLSEVHKLPEILSDTLVQIAYAHTKANG